MDLGICMAGCSNIGAKFDTAVQSEDLAEDLEAPELQEGARSMKRPRRAFELNRCLLARKIRCIETELIAGKT